MIDRSKMEKRLITILPLLLLLPGALFAQVSLTGGIGGGMSFVHTKKINTVFSPVVRPNAFLSTSIPIVKGVALQIGAGYAPKGYNTNQTEHFGPNKSVFKTETRLDFLTVPLMVSGRMYKNEKAQVWLDGGMNYNLFLKGHTHYDYSTYMGDERTSNMGYTYKVKGRFSPSKYSNTANSYDVNGLDAALKVQVRYIYKKKYTVSAYYEQSLYDLRANPGDDGTSMLKARYAGVSLGYTIF